MQGGVKSINRQLEDLASVLSFEKVGVRTMEEFRTPQRLEIFPPSLTTPLVH